MTDFTLRRNFLEMARGCILRIFCCVVRLNDIVYHETYILHSQTLLFGYSFGASCSSLLEKRTNNKQIGNFLSSSKLTSLFSLFLLCFSIEFCKTRSICSSMFCCVLLFFFFFFWTIFVSQNFIVNRQLYTLFVWGKRAWSTKLQ